MYIHVSTIIQYIALSVFNTYYVKVMIVIITRFSFSSDVYCVVCCLCRPNLTISTAAENQSLMGG